MTASATKNSEYPPKGPSRLTKTTPTPEKRANEANTPTDKDQEFTQIIQIPDAELSPPEQKPADKS